MTMKNTTTIETILMHPDHPSIASCHDIYEICQPLFQDLGFNYFCYTKAYPDNSRFQLASSARWTKHFFESGYQQLALTEKNPSQYESRVILHDTYSHQPSENAPILQDAKNLFDFSHPISILNKTDEYLECFHFASPSSESHLINKKNLANIELLKRFIYYFKSQAHDIIEKAESERFYTCNNEQSTNDKKTSSENVDNFLIQTKNIPFVILPDNQGNSVKLKGLVA